MKLFLSIVLATILSYLLLMMGPLVGGIIALGIVLGCLFRGLYLLNEISKRLSIVAPKTDKVKEAYANYLKEKGIKNQDEDI
ncbi:hypothetical protein [Gottfriedia luciferensis]|uniref:hypothetical protein n=1 Tax=Gottfriedia luciferensis TaxID=178774 RepID=UPI000B44E324|nr:hypothetical protein [Gottfriedia luciferensis]